MISLYIYVYTIIAIFSIVTIIKPNLDKKLYPIGMLVLSLFLCLRFGQGADYPGYLAIYHLAKEAFDPSYGVGYYIKNIHSEIGWQLIMILLHCIKMDFQVFVVILSGIMMWLTHLFIKRFCNEYKSVALVLIYPTVYLTYYFSGLRQGLAMIIFSGILLNLLLERKYIKYFVGVLLLSTVHKASLIYLIVPIIIHLSKKWFIIGSVFSVAVAMSMILEPIREIINNIAVAIGVSPGYFGEPSVGWLSLLERSIMLFLITILWKFNDKKESNNSIIEVLLKIYYAGFLIYICLCSNAFVSSRLVIAFKMLEMVIIPLLLTGAHMKVRKIVMIGVLCISTVMTYKNLNTYAAKYHDDINGWNYPYVTIFNQEDILVHRDEYVSEYPDEMYNFYEHEYFWQ